jgi:uracil-DNA glycosylase family 4
MVANRRVLLNRLYAAYAQDQALTAARGAGRRIVAGDGPTDPKRVFVGLAPGSVDQRTGYAYAGAAGRVLEELLGSVGMAREEVFLTYLVKYRRADNAEPTDAERSASMRYMRTELRILGNPPVVMLGRHVTSAASILSRRKVILPSAKMELGKWSWLQLDKGFAILPLHDPAYGVYQKRNLPLMHEQFKAVLDPPSYQIF